MIIIEKIKSTQTPVPAASKPVTTKPVQKIQVRDHVGETSEIMKMMIGTTIEMMMMIMIGMMTMMMIGTMGTINK